METIVMFGAFLVLVAIGIPIAFSIGLSVLGALLISGIPITVFAQRVANAADNGALLAIPLFILSGELMNRGGLTQRLVNFAHSIVGHIRGGLGHTCVLGSMIFAGVSGSAVADTTAIGSIMVPAMIKKNYKPPFVAALQAGAGTLGPIFPPSILMILYGSMTEVSVGGLFLSGCIPGVLIGLGLMVVVYIFTSKRFHPDIEREKWAGFLNILKTGKEAIPALVMPFLILVGIVAGIFTPTEAGSVAVCYSFLVGMFYYKAFTLKDMPAILLSAASLAAMVMSIIVFASAFGWLMAWQGVPDAALKFMTTLTSNKYVFLIIVIAFLLTLGHFMEVLAMATIFGPLLNIIGQRYGFDPVYFGLIILITMQMGGIGPPVGIILNLSCGLAHCKTEETLIYLCVCIFAMLAVIALIIVYPPVAMTLPNMFIKH
jgi:C4-dicarboxylate transporter DctM subunit